MVTVKPPAKQSHTQRPVGFVDLPPELAFEILYHVQLQDLTNLSCVSEGFAVLVERVVAKKFGVVTRTEDVPLVLAHVLRRRRPASFITGIDIIESSDVRGASSNPSPRNTSSDSKLFLRTAQRLGFDRTSRMIMGLTCDSFDAQLAFLIMISPHLQRLRVMSLNSLKTVSWLPYSLRIGPFSRPLSPRISTRRSLLHMLKWVALAIQGAYDLPALTGLLQLPALESLELDIRHHSAFSIAKNFPVRTSSIKHMTMRPDCNSIESFCEPLLKAPKALESLCVEFKGACSNDEAKLFNSASMHKDSLKTLSVRFVKSEDWLSEHGLHARIANVFSNLESLDIPPAASHPESMRRVTMRREWMASLWDGQIHHVIGTSFGIPPSPPPLLRW
jgi:hypothetical protein